MNVSIQPTNLIPLIDQPYVCVNEYNLSVMQRISEIITNPSYMPFKVKTKKKAQSYTQSYVSNAPHTDHVFELLLDLQPIGAEFFQHSSFKLSQSVKTMQLAYSKLGYTLDRPVNPLFLNNADYLQCIKSAVDAFVYELKSHSTSKVAITDRNKRVDLINEIKKINTSVMKKLFKKHQRFNLNLFSYVFNMEECQSLRNNALLEKLLAEQISTMINNFHEKHRSEILALFFCVQRDLSENYTLTVYCATDHECPSLSMKDCLKIVNDKYFIVAPHSNITLMINENLSEMDIQGVDGANEKVWKVIIEQMIARYNYVYYESDHISPKFIYKEC